MLRNKRAKVINMTDLSTGSIPGRIIRFAIPIFIGQALQNLYNIADAWVIGNYADNNAFAAVSTMGIIVFLVVGFCAGLSVGGSVIVSRYFGAGDEYNTSKAIHTNYTMAIIISVLATVFGLLVTPRILVLIDTPPEVMPHALTYLTIYFGGISTVVFYNIGTSVMRALGDSLHPLYYLAFSSILNIALDLLFVAHPSFRWGVAGAAAATVISQGLSALLCIIRQCRANDFSRLILSKIRLYPQMFKEVISLGMPAGLQNALLTVGNLVVQKNVNSFGTYAMSGFGAYVKVEAVVFLPILAMALSMPTFVSQNIGAGKYDRAKKGAAFGLICGMASAEIIGLMIYFFSPQLLRFFIDQDEAIRYGVMHSHIVPPFYFLLAFAHCSAGIMRGCGKAIIPMLNMFTFWCVGRILYVSIAIKMVPVFTTISWAYPIVWAASDIVFLLFLLKSNWAGDAGKEKRTNVR